MGWVVGESPEKLLVSCQKKKTMDVVMGKQNQSFHLFHPEVLWRSPKSWQHGS